MENEDRGGGERGAGGMGARFRDALLEAYGPGREAALPGLLALYDEDLQFRDPMQELRGREAFAKMNRQFLGSVRSVEVSVRDLVEGEGSFFMAWTMRVAARIGPAVTVQGVTHARTRGGKIVEQRDYFDLAGSVLGALPGVSAAYRFVTKKLV